MKNNVTQLKTRPELAVESRRDDIKAATGIGAKVMSHAEMMKLDPDSSPAVIKVYQDYYNDPANQDK